MKSKQKKQEDLNVLTERFQNSRSAIVLSFKGLTVNKDQQFRNELRETGATYKVIKNTLARIAVKGTSYEEIVKRFKGMTSVVWTDDEPIDLSKVISKYVKECKNIVEFKTGMIDGEVVDLNKVKAIASLPSREDLIAKLLYVLNATARGVTTTLNAVPRNMTIVMKQISERPEDRNTNEGREELAEKEDQNSDVGISENHTDVNKKEEIGKETNVAGKKSEGDHKKITKK